MTAPTCARCGRPCPDGYVDVHCGVTKPAEQLAAIADMTAAARDIAHGQARGGAGGSGSEPRLPLNLGATQRLDQVQATLTTWARHIAAERGLVPPWVGYHGDPITAAAQWLADHLEWSRHRPQAEEFLADVEACARIVAGIARGPSDKRYLGPCGVPVEEVDEDAEGGPVVYEVGYCEGDVYAREGAQDGRCRACGAEVAVGDRQRWLDAEVRSRAFRAKEIADAYDVNVNTIRTWHARGVLVAHGEDRDGRPLFNVGETLDMFRALKVRRAEDQARKARRADSRAAMLDDARSD